MPSQCHIDFEGARRGADSLCATPAVLKGSLRKLFMPVHLGGAGGFACQPGIARLLPQLARPSFEQAKPPAPPTRLTVTRANALIPKVQHTGTNLCGIGMPSCPTKRPPQELPE